MKNLVLCFDRSSISSSSSSSPPSSVSSTSNYSPIPAYITSAPPPPPHSSTLSSNNNTVSSSSQPQQQSNMIPVNPISISTSAIVSPRSQQQQITSPKLSASQPMAQNPTAGKESSSASGASSSALATALSPRKQIVFRGDSMEVTLVMTS